MIRSGSLAATALLVAMLASAASADPNRCLVQVTFGPDSTQVAVSGGTRVKTLLAVLRGLEESKQPCGSVTVGPWLKLPDGPDPAQAITIYIDDRLEQGKATAFMSFTPEVPFKVVASISEALDSAGCEQVRLLSDETLRSELLDALEVQDKARAEYQPPSEAAGTTNSQKP